MPAPDQEAYLVTADSLDGKALLGTQVGESVSHALAADPFNFGDRLTVTHIQISCMGEVGSGIWQLSFIINPDESPVPELDPEVFSGYEGELKHSKYARDVDYMNWHSATVIGHRNFAMLQGHGSDPFRPPANPFTLASLPDNGWRENPTHSPVRKFPRALGPMYQHLGLQMNPNSRDSPIAYITHRAGVTNQPYPGYPPPWHFGDDLGYYFVAVAQIQQGVLLSMSSLPVARRPGDAQMVGVPPLYSFSDIMGIFWYRKTSSQPSDNHPLKYWIIHIIQDFATLSVLSAMAFKSDHGKTYLPVAPGIECRPGSDDFNAVLGTPVGNEVTWSLASNPSNYHARRTVSTIYCFGTHGDATFYAYNLVFVLDDVQAQNVQDEEMHGARRASDGRIWSNSTTISHQLTLDHDA